MNEELWTRRDILKTAAGGLAFGMAGCSSTTSVPEGLHSQGAGTGLFFDLKAIEHNRVGHPESQVRLESFLESPETRKVFQRMSFRPAARISNGLIAKYHSEEMINKIRKGEGGYFSAEKGAPYLTEETYEVALRSVGGVVQICEDVSQGWLRNGYALVRPPGHQATRTEPRGYCVFNNVAIATELLLARQRAEKVAILDLDAHHGSGTQEFFYSNPNVLYISVHQASLSPGVGQAEEVGEGEAKGTTLNIPVPNKTGDLGYRLLYESVIGPAVKRFQPGIILVSMGYNSHWREYGTDLGMSLEGYQFLDQKLMALAKSLCSGRLVYCLEGGQNAQVLAEGASNSMRSLLRRKRRTDSFGKSPFGEPDLSQLASRLRRLHTL